MCSDAYHYGNTGLSVQQAMGQLRLDGHKFEKFGSELPGADIPTPYFLPKLKDILAK